jgi:outer membrane protein assembly factor BamB
MGDVPTYKGDATRSGIQPGPGPIAEPVEAWRTDIGCSVGARTPALGAGVLVIGCDDAKLVALDALTGMVLWQKELAGGQVGSSPAIEGSAVFVGESAGRVRKLDLHTDQVIWESGLAPMGNLVVTGGRLYVVDESDNPGLYGLDPATKEVIWDWFAPEGIHVVDGTVVGGVAYTGTEDGQLIAVSVASGRELWRFRTVTGRISTPAIGEHVIAVSALGDTPRGEVYALVPSTGEELWRYTSESGTQIAPPSLVGDIVVVPSSLDGVHAFNALTGKQLWRIPTGPNHGQAIAIAGDVAYLNTQDSLVAISISEGAKLWEITLPALLEGSPVVSGGMIFFGDNAGIVHAYAEPGLAAKLPRAYTPPPPSPTPSSVGLLELVATFDAQTTAGLDLPSGIAVGPGGELYVVNAGTHEVLVLEPGTGRVVRRWGGLGSGEGQFDFRRKPNVREDNEGGVAVALDGTVYVGDVANHRIQYFTSDGVYLGQWGRFGRGPGQFTDAWGVFVGPDKTVYVNDDGGASVQHFSADGKFIDFVCEAGPAPGQCGDSGGIFVASDGTVYRSEWSRREIQAWDAQGTSLWSRTTRGVGPIPSANPAGLAVDAGGRIYLAMQGYVYVFSADRAYLGSEYLDPEDTWAISLGSDGYMYVTSQWSHKIFKLRPIQ